MKLTHLHISNFLSFGEDIAVDFTRNGSLVLIKGEIEDSENSNGSGKSSLFESVYWSLTGKTVRGVRAADVVRHGCKKVSVTSSFTHGSKRLSIQRSWSQREKTLTLDIDGTTERFHDAKQGTQRVFEVLGISQDILSLVAFYGRKFHTFSKLSPRERAEFIDYIAQGEELEKARVVAVSRVKDIEISIIGKQENLTSLLSRRDRLDSSIRQLEQDLLAAREETNRLIQEEEVNLDKHKNDLQSLQAKQISENQLDADTAAARKQIAELEEAKKLESARIKQQLKQVLENLSEEIATKEEELKSLVEVRFELAGDLAESKRTIRDKEKQKGSTHCVACKQPLPNPPDVAQLNKEIEALTTKTTAFTADLVRADRVINDHHQAVAEKRKEHSRITGALDLDVARSDRLYQDKIKSITDERVRVEDDFERLQNQIVHQLRLITSTETTLDDLRQGKGNATFIRVSSELGIRHQDFFRTLKEIDTSRASITALEGEKALAAYWKQGFKDLRFSSFESVIGILEDLLNSFLQQQGLDFEKIEVDSFKDNSTGKSVPELNFYVIRDGKRMRLESLSEGETQKVDLACFFTFGILIQKSTGFDCDLTVLDEPLSGLDQEGREKVFSIITDLSKTRTVFTIDHDANFQDLFSDLLVVRKVSGVSTLVRA